MSWTHCFTPVPATIVCEASTLVVPVANTDRYYIHLVSFTRGEERRQKDEMKATANILVNLHFHNFSSSSSSSQLEPNAERHTPQHLLSSLPGERTKESERREKKTKGENRNERRHKHKVWTSKKTIRRRGSRSTAVTAFYLFNLLMTLKCATRKLKQTKQNKRRRRRWWKQIGSLDRCHCHNRMHCPVSHNLFRCESHQIFIKEIDTSFVWLRRRHIMALLMVHARCMSVLNESNDARWLIEHRRRL